jgi:hypothetical protein
VGGYPLIHEATNRGIKDMNDKDLIAKFIAERGVTRVPMGVRTMTERQMKEAIGYEPETMPKFEVYLQGEDGGHWMEVIAASSAISAEEKIKRLYPEAFVISVAPKGTREMEIYKSIW